MLGANSYVIPGLDAYHFPKHSCFSILIFTLDAHLCIATCWMPKSSALFVHPLHPTVIMSVLLKMMLLLNIAPERIQRKYADLPGLVQLVDLNRGSAGMGLGLAGNKDRSKMSVFVAGIQPDSPAERDGRIQVGDELLEVCVLSSVHFFFF